MNMHREMLVKLYELFNHRDIDGVLDHLHPEVHWPNGWEGGSLHGREAVRDYWTRQWRELDPHVEPVGFEFDASGRVVVQVQAVIRNLAGQIVSEGRVHHIYTIEDDLVRAMEIQPSSG